MRAVIDEVLVRHGRVASRRTLLDAVGVAALDDEIRRRRLVRPFRRVYCREWEADQIEVIERAALLSVGAPAALSHLTALRRWGAHAAPDDVHVSIPAGRSSRTQPGLSVHRVARAPSAVLLEGLPTVRPAPAIVTSWPLLGQQERRGPAIDAVRTGILTPAELRAELARHPRLRYRWALADLVDLLAAGCESELEIWGLLGVFDVPGLRHAVRQRRIRIGGRAYRLDLAYEAEKVCVELDGDRFHSSREARDRDRRRDAALAAAGWLTLRFTHHRLHHDVDGCRRDTLATLAVRRT